MKKIIFFILLIAAFGAAFSVGAMTEQERQNLITQINAQIALLQAQLLQVISQQSASSSWCADFGRNLGYANSGTADVVSLHTALQKEGISYSPDNIYTYSEGTARAVAEFQEQYGIYPQSGYFGTKTRAKINQLYACETAPVQTQEYNNTQNQNTNITSDTSQDDTTANDVLPPDTATDNTNTTANTTANTSNNTTTNNATTPPASSQCARNADCQQPGTPCSRTYCLVNLCKSGRCVMTNMATGTNPSNTNVLPPTTTPPPSTSNCASDAYYTAVLSDWGVCKQGGYASSPVWAQTKTCTKTNISTGEITQIPSESRSCTPTASDCVATCANKTCGASNGCGGQCSSGSCQAGQVCKPYTYCPLEYALHCPAGMMITGTFGKEICYSGYNDWICPAGQISIYQNSGYACSALATCPAGLKYTDYMRACNATPTCPAGMTLITHGDTCVGQQQPQDQPCPADSSWYGNPYYACVSHPICPAGSQFKLWVGDSFHPQAWTCQATPSCSTGGTPIRVSNGLGGALADYISVCLAGNATPSCPSGQTYYNSNLGCTVAPTCSVPRETAYSCSAP